MNFTKECFVTSFVYQEMQTKKVSEQGFDNATVAGIHYRVKMLTLTDSVKKYSKIRYFSFNLLLFFIFFFPSLLPAIKKLAYFQTLRL